MKIAHFFVFCVCVFPAFLNDDNTLLRVLNKLIELVITLLMSAAYGVAVPRADDRSCVTGSIRGWSRSLVYTGWL